MTLCRRCLVVNRFDMAVVVAKAASMALAGEARAVYHGRNPIIEPGHRRAVPRRYYADVAREYRILSYNYWLTNVYYLLSCLFDTKACVYVMSWNVTTW